MDKAYQIANDNLRACFENGGITASIDHFNDFWARDAFFASWGFLETGENQKVKSNLELFIKYQKENGQIPVRIDRFFVGLHYLGIKIKRKSLRPKYCGAYVFPPLDQNILFAITCFKYIKRTNDLGFLRKRFDAISRAMKWLEKYEQEIFLKENLFANWMDVVVKTGTVLYTNVLYAEALKSFSEIGVLLGRTDIAQKYTDKHQQLTKEMNNKFWGGEFYIDWINKNRRYGYFSADGNVLAMLFGISNQEQNRLIIRQIEKFKLDKIPLKTNYPSYPWWRVAPRMYLIGMSGYQNNFASWLWLGCLYAVALYKNNYKEKAESVSRKITSKIEEYGAVYETYNPNGQPYKGWFWKSAVSFAWSSGLYLWMEKSLGK